MCGSWIFRFFVYFILFHCLIAKRVSLAQSLCASKGESMNVFISWSGDQSKQYANVLRKLLPLVIQDIRLFMSKHDLESGTRWGQQLATQLETSHFGIFCLTPENLNSPWLLFEAGALTKMAEGKACGILFDGVSPSNITGPLSQFQHRNFDYEGVRDLLGDLNKNCSNILSETQLNTIFKKFWPDLQDQCSSILNTMKSNDQLSARNSDEILEELVVAVRDMERRIESMATTRNTAELNSVIHQSLAHLDIDHLRPLTSLVSISGTRSVQEYGYLINEGSSPEVIENLIELGILRKSSRDGKEIVEITHDSIASAAMSYITKVLQADDQKFADENDT